MFPSMPSNPLDRVFTVFCRTEGGVIISPGVVVARDHVLADTKARRIFGNNCWTKLKEAEPA